MANKTKMENDLPLQQVDPRFAEIDEDGLPNRLATPEGRKAVLARDFESLKRKHGVANGN